MLGCAGIEIFDFEWSTYFEVLADSAVVTSMFLSVGDFEDPVAL